MNGQNGKGDTPRPLSVTQETYKSNYERIFGKKEDICEYSGLPSTESYDRATVTREIPPEIQEKLDEITHKIEEYESTISRQTEGNDEAR